MKVLIAIGLLIFTSSVLADVMRVKVKTKNSDESYSEAHNPHSHNSHRHNSRGYNSRGHRSDRHRGSSHYNYGRRWWNYHVYGYAPRFGYTPKRHGNQYHRPHNWIKAEQFRTRTKHRSDPVIHINARVSAIGLTSLKRHASIYEVWAELGNGNRIPLRSLEGSLYYGTSHTRYFDNPRYVKRLFLRVGPEYRHHRAYVSVDYLPAENRRHHRD